MYYSIVPYENLFPPEPNEFDYKEVQHKGNTLQLYKREDKYIIKRVISTDPAAYLNASISPGQEFKF